MKKKLKLLGICMLDCTCYQPACTYKIISMFEN